MEGTAAPSVASTFTMKRAQSSKWPGAGAIDNPNWISQDSWSASSRSRSASAIFPKAYSTLPRLPPIADHLALREGSQQVLLCGIQFIFRICGGQLQMSAGAPRAATLLREKPRTLPDAKNH
jgi:hypothetical protein